LNVCDNFWRQFGEKRIPIVHKISLSRFDKFHDEILRFCKKEKYIYNLAKRNL